MNRGDFKRLAALRLREAEALLRARQFSGAYYLGGYAVECALKACIAKKTRRYDFPPRPKLIQEYDSHDLEQLVRAASLDIELTRLAKTDLIFRDYWLIVRKWSEQSRYEFMTE